jgi:hypothetical protein
MKTLILNSSITGKLAISFTLQLLYPRGGNSRNALNNMLGRAQIHSGCVSEDKNPFCIMEAKPHHLTYSKTIPV